MREECSEILFKIVLTMIGIRGCFFFGLCGLCLIVWVTTLIILRSTNSHTMGPKPSGKTRGPPKLHMGSACAILEF